MGELALVVDHSTVPLTRVSCNTVFSKSQKTRKAGTLCISENGRHISKIIFTSKLHMFISRWGEMSVVLTAVGAILLFDEV